MAEKLLKGGAVTLDPRLDRVAQFDDASRNHQVRTLLDSRSLVKKIIKVHRPVLVGPTLDQGQEGACTAYSVGHAVHQKPFSLKPYLTQAQLHELYFENQQRDDWPGGEYPGATPQYGGSSVLASMKTLAAHGWIKSYKWIGAGSGKAIDDLIETVRYIGPVNLGVNWYESMYNTTPAGILEIDMSKQVGGHAICAIDSLTVKLPKTSKRDTYIVLQNSWGPRWGSSYKGQGGFAYVRAADMERLLNNDGEGAVPMKG